MLNGDSINQSSERNSKYETSILSIDIKRTQEITKEITKKVNLTPTDFLNQ